MPTQRFAELVQQSDNYFVIATREKLPMLPYSIKEIDFGGRCFIVDFFFFVAILRKCSGKPEKMVIFISKLPVAI